MIQNLVNFVFATRLQRAALVLIALLFFTACSLNRSNKHFSSNSAVQEWKLPNGLTVMFLPDEELPLVNASLLIRGGAYWQGPNELGMLNATGELIRSGGSSSFTPEELDLVLENLGASVSSSFAPEYGNIGFNCLSADLEQVFRIFSELVLKPRFDPEKLELWRSKTLESIRRRTEDPFTVASIATNQLIYQGSQFGLIMGSNDAKKITVNDLKKMHQRFVVPERSILVISGRVDRETVSRLVLESFQNWKTSDQKLAEFNELQHVAEKGIYFIEVPLSQSAVLISHLGQRRFSSDYIAIDGFNELFGGSEFDSRLFKRVRTELGLAYMIGGGFQTGVFEGLNMIYFQTKAETTALAIEQSLEVINLMRTDPPSYSELDVVKQAINNSFVFNFQNPATIIQRQAQQRLLAFPEDYDELYLERINSLKPEQIQLVANKHWDPDKFVYVVVGNKQALFELKRSVSDTKSPLYAVPLHEMQFVEKLLLP